ncbi:U1 small nuclear ribonucleoprotein 70 kDa-like [Ctenocephalides felis]|uniref:U1 small nuclear ribonucleoprotein 70 kDa-like n=1 Tax=Ctenocephalides felis TaxID=7515 RepID=UPI000E6E1558|nr:U1 small nuclear ribonucleoprotein 70 kDa-like [Ctenocephalides felis]
MTQFLPANLLALFAPREPIKHLPPACKLPHEKKNKGYVGIAQFVKEFEDPKETPPPTRVETKEERLERRRRERAEQVAYKLEQEIAVWDPTSSESATVDPFKTLFVARINYDTTESKLRREFEGYGPIKKIVVIHNAINGKPRGYSFIEYEHERDMHSAYKHADGKKIDGRRVLVDVERARTVKGWLPRRLGGGLGGTRRGGPEVNIKHSGREDNERERERYRLEREREERGDIRRDRDRGDRDRERERDRGLGAAGGLGSFDRDRRRSRSRDRPKRRSRSRSRDRSDRKRRPRSKEADDTDVERVRDRERRDKERDRSDRDRKRRRSRSRDREGREKDRSDRKRDKRDRERAERKERKVRVGDFGDVEVKVKDEPLDDYPDYTQYTTTYNENAVKYEDENEEKYKIPENNGNSTSGYTQEEGEYDESNDY